MKKLALLILVILLFPCICRPQEVAEVLRLVAQKQDSIRSLLYTINRTDTIGTLVRYMSGTVVMEKNEQDTIFGFRFWSKKENDPIEKMYDGHVGYSVNTTTKKYETMTNSKGFYNLLNGGGGHLIVPDLIKLDTAKTIDVSIIEDEYSYLLTFRYADLDQYDITNKFKAVRVSKQSLLPVSVREHQESFGRIQDLYYDIKGMRINPETTGYDFSHPGFLASYQHAAPARSSNPIMGFMGKDVPYFEVETFANGRGWVSTSDFKNKVVLLDFWEVWCSPCIASMPKIEGLYTKYGDRGLLVYGIVNDVKNKKASEILVEKRGIKIPMLMGSGQLRDLLKITSIPLYLLIDRAGKVVFLSEGYSDAIEAAIIKALE